MSELGNDLINNIYEANTGASVKPTMESSRLIIRHGPLDI